MIVCIFTDLYDNKHRTHTCMRSLVYFYGVFMFCDPIHRFLEDEGSTSLGFTLAAVQTRDS